MNYKKVNVLTTRVCMSADLGNIFMVAEIEENI